MKKILVTGADGLVGNSIKSLAIFENNKYIFDVQDKNNKKQQFEGIFINRNDADLTNEQQVERIFEVSQPDYVVHTAARVGGIGRNLNSPVQQFTDNILMNTHVINKAYKHNVKKLIAFSSVCAFPSNAQVLKEDCLHDGTPYPAHMSYAYSKRMVDVLIQAYKQQYGINYCSVIPGNIFGEHDNFNLQDGHVIPSLLHKAKIAKDNNTNLQVWGDGTSTREFLYAKDVAKICLNLLSQFDELPLRLIVSGEKEHTIKEIVQFITEITKHDKVFFDLTKPNGQTKRLTDQTLFKSLFPEFVFEDLKQSLNKTFEWLDENYEKARK
jgi:GDP-L-fucose synthase